MDKEEYRSYIKGFMKGWAPFYDFFTEIFISGVRRKVVDLVEEDEGSWVLDVATGTGKQAFAFGEKGYRVIGIDLSEDVLRIARKKNKHKNVGFEIADAAEMPFKNCAFDITCISFGLHDMPPNVRKKALGEMVRVTKPNGTLLIIDYASVRSKAGRLVYPIVSLYESKYYRNFVECNLEELLEETGVELNDERRALFGIVRILTGHK